MRDDERPKIVDSKYIERDAGEDGDTASYGVATRRNRRDVGMTVVTVVALVSQDRVALN